MQRKSTMTDLVVELEKVQPRTPLIEQIIAEAKAGEFHDYKNTKYDCGKVAAYGLLLQAGLVDLAKQIRDGVYDEEADADDIEYLKSFAPRSMWKMLGLDKPAGSSNENRG